MDISEIQREYLASGCPECGADMHAVPNTDGTETYLWCNQCDVSMDNAGGYTK